MLNSASEVGLGVVHSGAGTGADVDSGAARDKGDTLRGPEGDFGLGGALASGGAIPTGKDSGVFEVRCHSVATCACDCDKYSWSFAGGDDSGNFTGTTLIAPSGSDCLTYVTVLPPVPQYSISSPLYVTFPFPLPFTICSGVQPTN